MDKFDELWKLHPSERGKIIMYGKEQVSCRYHKSYLKTPEYDPEEKHSYMFSGFDNDKNNERLPDQVVPLLEFVNADQKNPYNQIVINWYENGQDYIAFHSDCTIGMRDFEDITIISLDNNSNDNNSRIFELKVKELTETPLY